MSRKFGTGRFFGALIVLGSFAFAGMYFSTSAGFCAGRSGITGVCNKESCERFLAGHSAYGAGSFVYKDKFNIIEGPGNSGHYFRFKLDSSKMHVMRVRGKSAEGKAILRVQADVNPPSWYAADGEIEIPLAEADSVEMLIYSESSFSYVLEEISFRNCETCKTDEEFRRRLYSEIDGLSSESDKLKKALLLLRWAAPRINWAIGDGISRTSTDYIGANLVGQSFGHLFSGGNGGVYCGGAAQLFAKTLGLFGIDAFTIDFGDQKSGLTHVSVIVPVFNPSGWSFYLVDPTFNSTITHRREIIDLFRALDIAKKGRAKELSMSEGDLSNRVWVVDRAMYESRAETAAARSKREPYLDELECFEVSGRIAKCRHPKFNFEKYDQEMSHQLTKSGYRTGIEGLIELFEHQVFTVSGASESEAVLEFKKNLRIQRIPLAN